MHELSEQLQSEVGREIESKACPNSVGRVTVMLELRGCGSFFLHELYRKLSVRGLGMEAHQTAEKREGSTSDRAAGPKGV